MQNLKETQVFTPAQVTNKMLDLLDQSDFFQLMERNISISTSNGKKAISKNLKKEKMK
ncbi:MAG: hypothetical protein MOGMAGMI_00292 [Candidatus Omnitrophica bacterium]|nr:hypothetical protein [Candidatus Omnitrophota bacterium]